MRACVRVCVRVRSASSSLMSHAFHREAEMETKKLFISLCKSLLNRYLPLLGPLDGLTRLRAAINVNKTNRSVRKGIRAPPCPHQELEEAL